MFQPARGLLRRKGSNQQRFQTARRLVKKVFQQAKLATSSRTRRTKGSPTKHSCSQVEDSSSKRFIIRQGVLELVGTSFPQAGRNLSGLENFFNDDSSCWLQHWLVLKPFRRPLLELVKTLAGWKTFSTGSFQAN